MKRLALGSPTSPQDIGWAHRALKLIEQASVEDIEATITNLTISGSYTETRTLTPSTATLSDLVNFIATMVTDIQKRGQNRTGG